MTLVAILSSFLGLYIIESFDAWKFFSGQKSMAMSSRAAINQIVRELKRADGIQSPTTQQVTFYDNIDEHWVTFVQSGTDLMRNTGVSSDVLLDDLKTPIGVIFTCWDEDGEEAEDPGQIRLVRCRLIVGQGQNRFVIESAAGIRIK